MLIVECECCFFENSFTPFLLYGFGAYNGFLFFCCIQCRTEEVGTKLCKLPIYSYLRKTRWKNLIVWLICLNCFCDTNPHLFWVKNYERKINKKISLFYINDFLFLNYHRCIFRFSNPQSRINKSEHFFCSQQVVEYHDIHYTS